MPVTTNTLKGLTSGTETDINDLKYQLATAWVNLDGTGTVAIRDAYNVSSITDRGTGKYNVNFEESLENNNYSVTGMGMENRRIQYDSATFSSAIQSVNGVAVRNTNSITDSVDEDCINIVVHGGKN